MSTSLHISKYQSNISIVISCFLSCSTSLHYKERKFDKIVGVLSTTVGYTGASNPNKLATYKSICSGDGNVEAIAIEYDPRLVSYSNLLERFMALHDPTKRKKRQYCSAIFTCSSEQDVLAKRIVGANGENIATKIEVLLGWHDAEKRHQKYYEKKAKKKAAMVSFGQRKKVLLPANR